jgi:hypothetical protein
MNRTFSSLTVVILISLVQLSVAQAPMKWKIHDLNRPVPAIIDPGTASTQETPGRAPSDAVVLFEGKDLSHWVDGDAKPAKWKVENGYMEVVAKTGNISTRDSFGDCQLHVEFAEPSPGVGESQERGNSGVFLMSTYEIQVLDSYQNKTYADGQASAVYGQYPPLVNAARPPAQWQTYDIIFHRPHFKDGKVTQPARVTVLHNGVLVQDNVELTGPTAHGERPPYKPGPDKLPLQLQDHGNPVRYRHIWIRELQEGQ